MPNPSAPSGQLDTSLLEERCRFFLVQGLAQSTQKSYASGQRRFYNFCLQAGKLHPTGSPCPTDEWTLCLFVAFLADSIQHSSIKVYLSAVRSLHIEQGLSFSLKFFVRSIVGLGNSGACWVLELEVPSPPCVTAPSLFKHLQERFGRWPLAGLRWIPPSLCQNCCPAPPALLRHQLPSSSIVDEFKCG